MKNPSFILITISLLLLIISCKKDQGVRVTEDRSVSSFHTIIIDHRINLTITQDTIEKLQVMAGINTISSVITLITDSTLTIQNKDNSTINDPGNFIEVKLSVKNLRTIEYQGSGNIASTNKLTPSSFTIVSTKGVGIINLEIETDHLVAGIYEENADFIFRGKANTAFVYCSSRGTIDLKEMEVKKMNMVYSSVRNGFVWVTENLVGTIYHTGNVFYKGNPVLQKEEVSSGRFLIF